MADVITRLKLESSEYDAKVLRASKSLAEMTHQAEVNGNKIATANKANVALAQSLGKMQTVATSVRGKMSELTAAFENATHSYNRLTAAEKNSPFGRALNQSVNQLQARVKGLRQEMATTQTQLGKTGGMGIGAQFGQGLSSAAAMFGPAAIAVGGVTAAIAGMKKVMGDIVSINMQFEQSTANLAAVMGTTKNNVTALTNQAKQLGATTQYTASQILELQANLARLGFNQNEILNSTKSVQAMATAMGADLGEAANLAGSALRGFGLNATEMERVASVLSVGTTKSALSFEKLATALPIVQTAAAKTGFTIEDTVAMLGKLTDNGINAASAATQLRKILNDSTTAGTKLANALGGPVKSFDELVVALDKAGKAGQNHADSVALVNSKNATALDILRDMAQQREVDVNGVKKQTSALQELRDSITDCSDGMKSMQDEQLNTLQGSITILNSAWEGLMLTFSESNGTIKRVVDSLTNLLTAYTNWRKRNQGGDAAISTYELGLTDESKKEADQVLAGYRAGGSTDKQIEENLTNTKKNLQEEEAELRKVYDLWEKRYNLIKSGKSGIAAKSSEFDLLKEKGLSNTTDVRDQLAKQIAEVRDQIAVQDYMLSVVAPPEVEKKTQTGGEGGSGAADKKTTAKLKAQYEEQEKAQIAALDRMTMNEEAYEAEVYRIRRETLEKIAGLYQEDTAEKARANAAISQLDIQYQGTQMRLANKANKANKPTKTTAEEYTGVGEFSQKAVGARMSHAKKVMDEAEIGSDRYLYEADKIVDLTTFQNLLKAATEAGMDIDTSFIEENLGQIDMGLGVSDEAWQKIVDSINAKLAELDLPAIELDVKTGAIKEAKKEMGGLADNVQGAIGVFGQLGGAMQQLEDPGAKVAGLIMSAIAEIAATFAASLKGTFTPWDWIAAAISGTSTMIATIAAIKSATSGSYASGGVVPGTSFSGDNTIIAANAGEVVLNRAQQTNLASQLEAGSLTNNLHLSTEISGTNLRVVLDNDNRSKGGSRGTYSRIK